MCVTEGSGWVEFDAVVEALPWGRNVSTIIRVEQELRPPRRPPGRVGSRAPSTKCLSMSG